MPIVCWKTRPPNWTNTLLINNSIILTIWSSVYFFVWFRIVFNKVSFISTDDKICISVGAISILKALIYEIFQSFLQLLIINGGIAVQLPTIPDAHFLFTLLNLCLWGLFCRYSHMYMDNWYVYMMIFASIYSNSNKYELFIWNNLIE